MYSYFFLLGLVKTYENRDYMAGKIAEVYEKIRVKDFPIFGVENSSGTEGFGVGEQLNLIKDLRNFSSFFPNCILSYYHFYWNCKFLTVYTIAEDKVYVDKHDLEKIKVGLYEISSSYDIKHTEISNNITSYLNNEYKN